MSCKIEHKCRVNNCNYAMGSFAYPLAGVLSTVSMEMYNVAMVTAVKVVMLQIHRRKISIFRDILELIQKLSFFCKLGNITVQWNLKWAF